MSLEQRFRVEAAKVRAYGSPRALMPYGRGVVIYWTNVSEYWCEKNAPPPFPFPPLSPS